MTRRKSPAVLLLFLLLFNVFQIFIFEAAAEPDQAAAEAGMEESGDIGEETEQDEEDEEEGGGRSFIPEWIVNAFQKLAEFLTDPGATLWKAFTKLIAILLDDILELFQNAFAVAFIYTEPFPADSWVKDWWSVTLLVFLGLVMIAVLSAVYRGFFAKDENGKGPWETFKPLALALLLSFFALFLVRFGTDVQNNVWQETLSPAISTTYGAGGTAWDGELSGVRADMVLKAMLTGGNMSGIDVNQLDSMGVSKVLYDPDSDRGSFAMMVIVMACLILIAFVAMLHIWVLALALVFSPLYTGVGALKTAMEPIIGIWNIILRSLFLQSLFGAFFLFVSSVRAEGQAGLGGASPDLITLILILVLVVLIHFLYLREILQAISSPGDLGGAKVITRTGRITAAVAGGAAGIAAAVGVGGKMLSNSERAGVWGRKLGRGIEKAAGWSGAGARMVQQGGQRLEREGVNAIPGAVKDGYGAVRDKAAARLKQTRDNAERGKTVEKIKDSFDRANKADASYLESLYYSDLKPEHDNNLEGYQGFKVNGVIRDKVMQATEDNYDSVPDRAYVWNTEGTQVWVHPAYAEKAEEILDDVAQEVQPLKYWKKGDGFIILQENIPVKVKTPPEDGVYMGEW